MRLPLIIATGAVLFSIAYKFVVRAQTEKVDIIYDNQKAVFSWAFVLIIIGVLGNIPVVAGVADLFSYVIIAIVVLNDGYDSIKAVVE